MGTCRGDVGETHQYCGGAATHEQLVPHLSSVAYLDRGRGRGRVTVRVRVLGLG